MRKPRRKSTFKERINLWASNRNLSLTETQQRNAEECLQLYENSTTNLYTYMTHFVQHDIKYWKQRIRRLVKRKQGSTKLDMLLKYGKSIAIEKWNSYCEFHRYKNTLKGKQELLGWSETQFNEYNHSRKQTLELMMRRHGEIEGKIKWNAYCKKQKTAGCSLSWFVNKYGEERGNNVWEEIKKSTAQTLENMINRYGMEEGKEKFFQYWNRIKIHYSKNSQLLFWDINTPTAYFGEKNKEFGKYDHENKSYYFYDFVDHSLMKCIEYYGDYWHANPNKFVATDIIHSSYTAQEVWDKDERKIAYLKDKGYDVLVVWESEYINNEEYCIQKCKEFLHGNN